MNGEAPAHPVEHLVKRLLDEAESLVQRDPAKAVMAAIGTGLALQALPTRAIVATMTAVTLTVMRPVLLTLGVIKALELCRSQTTRIS